jgi:hypothetical protein
MANAESRKKTIHRFLFKPYKCNQLLSFDREAVFLIYPNMATKIITTYVVTIYNKSVLDRFFNIVSKVIIKTLINRRNCRIGLIIIESISLECHPINNLYHQADVLTS